MWFAFQTCGIPFQCDVHVYRMYLAIASYMLGRQRLCTLVYCAESSYRFHDIDRLRVLWRFCGFYFSSSLYYALHMNIFYVYGGVL